MMQTKDKITFFSELNDALRRVYLDGRKPSQKVLDDPTYAGYSTGHWEGDTLVVDTVALRDDTFIEGFTPHSDEMTVHERIRLLEPTLLEDQITVTDPKALTTLGDGEEVSESEGEGREGRAARVRLRRRTVGSEIGAGKRKGPAIDLAGPSRPLKDSYLRYQRLPQPRPNPKYTEGPQ